jgi:hypothetical protein
VVEKQVADKTKQIDTLSRRFASTGSLHDSRLVSSSQPRMEQKKNRMDGNPIGSQSEKACFRVFSVIYNADISENFKL